MNQRKIKVQLLKLHYLFNLKEVFKNESDLFQKIVEKPKILLDILRVSLYIQYLVGHYN